MHCASILVLIGILGQAQTEMDQADRPTPAAATMAVERDQRSGASGESNGEASNGASSLRARLAAHMPDPDDGRTVAISDLEQAKTGSDRAAIAYTERLLERIDSIRRDRQVRLTLEDAIRTALSQSYAIRVESHNPAIELTRVVEAEAAFDALFFIDVVKRIEDKPSGSQLSSTDLDFFQLSTGIRKLLPTGMQVTGTYLMRRTKTSLSFQQLNPEYFNHLELALRQPLLRGFGIDYNRSVIRIAKNNRRLSDLAFFRMVQDTVHQVEERYWRLVQARREVVIAASTLADFERIYDWLVARRDFDVMEVQLQATKANLEQSLADFIRTRASVADAEDALLAAINDPDINLAEDVEIIPEDFPFLDPLAIDRLAEVQTALDQRPEIKEQKLALENAGIGVGRAKNEELPKLDLSFAYTIDGLAGTADKSFDELSRNVFNEYQVGVQFEVPIGNRGPRAAHRRARLEHAREQARLQQLYEQVILEVNIATRAVNTAHDQIGPGLASADARQREVDSIVARAERKDMNTLTNELNSRRSLAAARRTALNAIVEYNIAIIDLEKAKGTLLSYNNIVIDAVSP